MNGKQRSAQGVGGAGAGQELDRIRRLLELMQEHGLQELEIGADGRSLRLCKQSTAPVVVAAPGPVAAAPHSAPKAEESELHRFLSPMVGTFYRAPTPEATPYVREGDTIAPDSSLCIIEAMKVFNEIKAEMSGTIAQVLVENGEAVEYGQPLFLIRKAS